MTNRTKWLIALPFVFLVAFLLPALIARGWWWFANDWAEILFVALTAGMWLAATAFVDIEQPRGPRDATDNLIALGLIAAAPAAVIDRVYGLAARLPVGVSILGVALATAAIFLGVSARVALGSAFRPRATAGPAVHLVRSGPYRWVRHPLYAAALLWATGWPLIVASFAGAAVALVFLLPALVRRMSREEADLQRVLGATYVHYCCHTWRLVPFLY